MGCVSSAFLEDGDERRRIIGVSASASHHHHIVSLTSSTYGILTAPRAYSSSSTTSPSLHQHVQSPPRPPTPPPPPPPPPAARARTAVQSPPQGQSQQPQSEPQPEVINSWELMAGLLDPSTPAKTAAAAHSRPPLHPTGATNAANPPSSGRRCIRFPLRPIDGNSSPAAAAAAASPAKPNARCPPGGAHAAVLYTTSLRGVRATFEACNAVRAALQAHGVAFRERDVSMDRGFRDELRDLLPARAGGPQVPRLFVRGRHVGGAEEVLRLDEEGALAPLLEGLPRARGGACDGCGGMRFLPCFDCSGSRKVAVSLSMPAQAVATTTGKTSNTRRKAAASMVVRCRECNENGLVLCPICS
ncbi:hypothetical protein ACP70R_029113 [Stipagrostis hirtigluma subsp. patula]